MDKSHNQQYDWVGWSIKGNPYGEAFDLPARKRMVEGSQQLMPLLKQYEKFLGDYILEVGPFFNPLITPQNFPGKKIFYWENDRYVLQRLGQENKGKNVYATYCDLNKIDGRSLMKLKSETLKHFKKHGRKNVKFDSIVVSHVLNYIDYKLFLMVPKDFLRPGGLIFINNVPNYGLEEFFSDNRPKSIPETISTLIEAGYRIMEKEILPSPYPKHQKDQRLLLVAENNGREI